MFNIEVDITNMLEDVLSDWTAGNNKPVKKNECAHIIIM